MAHLSFPCIFFMIMIIMCSANSCFPFRHHVAAAAAAPGSVLSGNETDRLALLAFKAELIAGDPLGVLSSWNESNHFCKWVGVTCGRRHQRVTSLVLMGVGLQGSVSPHIGNLSFLRVLGLRNNSLSGNIPPEIGRLHRLQILSLSSNALFGNIPANISCCSNLVGLEFSHNNLSGEIPPELGSSVSKLEELYMRGNNISGVIPSTLGNLTFLKSFYAAENSIRGIIPDSLGRLKYLEHLGLAINNLVGTIPSSIFNLSSIYLLDFQGNQLHGKLPSDMGIALPNLQFFSVAINSLTESIPRSLSNASKLQIFQISDNQFTGEVPPLGNLHNLQRLTIARNHLGTGGDQTNNDLSFISSLTNVTSLSYLSSSDNNLGGVLPESVSNFSTNLKSLLLQANKISGNIPAWIGNLVNLETMGLFQNEFTGKIPDTIGKLKKLQLLGLQSNKLSGKVPPFLGNLTLLTEIDLSNNDFHGNIPSDLARCLRLALLSLYGNNLNGTIPSEITTSLSSLLYLHVNQNHLTGSLPVGIGNLINLEELYVGGNKLSGEIPSTLGSCVQLRSLIMGSNNFRGTIPSSLRYLRGMEELDLSRNNLSGKFPDFLADFLFLQFLNLSMNDFEGAVPERGRIFTNATGVDVSGNSKLCGGIPELHLPSCISKGSKRRRSHIALKIIIPTACGLVGLLLIMLFLYVSWSRKKKKAPILKILEDEFQKVSYGSLLKATGGFSPVNLIGVGGFGSVYKGTLDQDGGVVAVKVLNLEVRGASKSFIAECKALKSIRHRNLVKVLTAYSGIDYHGNDFKALVYEFMVNGSLEEWLHRNDFKADEEPRSLNLLQRLNIAIDVASALDYLHHHTSEPIVHCDLKPSNVLLDDEMTGRVSDFGLARFLPKATTNHDSSSIGIRGTVGYAPPEYGTGNEVSTSGDVYSYGILLLEMFTGKRPTDNMFSDGWSLHNFVMIALRDQVVADIVDPTILEQSENGEASSSINLDSFQNESDASSHKIEECLISVLEVGISCSEELPTNRMAINNAITRLNVTRKTHFGTRGVHGGKREGIAMRG